MSRKVDGIKSGEARAPQQFLFCFLQQPPRAANATQEWEKQLKAPQSQSPVQTVRPLHAAIPPRSPPPQHEPSGGFASAAAGSGAGGAGEGGGEGSQALRSGVPAGRGLHLWGLPLEEVSQRDGHGC